MKDLAYRLAYVRIALVNRVGHRAPMFVLNIFDKLWKHEEEVAYLYKKHRITVDQFDILVDRRIALSHAIERKMARR
jgi:hypothetical protein